MIDYYVFYIHFLKNQNGFLFMNDFLKKLMAVIIFHDFKIIILHLFSFWIEAKL
jgi:hypothetical protein